MKPWSDGSVLVVKDVEGNELRLLVQDNKLHVNSNGVVLDLITLSRLIDTLEEVYKVLTQH